MTTALFQPPRGGAFSPRSREHQLARASAEAAVANIVVDDMRGRTRLATWRSETRSVLDRLPASERKLLEQHRQRVSEERWQGLNVCSIDEAGAIALEHRRWMQATGQSFVDLYVMIEGLDPPTHLTPDDIFALLISAELTVARRGAAT